MERKKLLGEPKVSEPRHFINSVEPGDREGELILIERYVMTQRVTYCPPAYCAEVKGAEPVAPLPYYDEHRSFRAAVQSGFREAKSKR